MNHGPQLEFSDLLHAEKYRGEGETFREAMQRVASAISDGEEHYRALREILLELRFLPAGRVQAAMGSTKNVTPYNCFVSGRVADSFVHGSGSIMQRATEAATTMRMGGGIGYDFSTLRPRGATIRKLQSRSSGPVSFMEIFNAICCCVASSGHRRGAQMGVMRIDHPDIEEFIHAKQNQHRLTGFNVSVAVTDLFMEALVGGERQFPLMFEGEVYKIVDPRPLWEMLMRSTWDWAEPGVLFIDTINRENNLAYCETIAATNPCGEQPLPPHGACLLGSFNLARYLLPHLGREMALDLLLRDLAADVATVVRGMDNVIDRAIYPLYEQEEEARRKRRMGLGVTGLANALEACGHAYGSPSFLAAEQRVLETLRDASYWASVELAQEKGVFPAFLSQYTERPFIRRLPSELQAAIARHGIRNSHLTSIAPTGTISLAADNVSSGIEPVFALEVERTVRMDDGPHRVRVQDYGARVLGTRGRTADLVTVEEHLGVLHAAVPYVDSAISKTCNVPASMPWEQFQEVYVEAWRGGAKGCTTYRVGGRREAIMEEAATCRIDDETGRRECE